MTRSGEPSVMAMRFEFATAVRILFGPGCLRELAPLAKQYGQRALIVTGKDPHRAESLIGDLRRLHGDAVTFSVFGEPEVETIEQGVKLARIERCEFVVSLGGGSALDAGKAIAAMLANGGELLDYLEVIGRGKPLTKPSVPFFAVPTTAGTGSEV